MATVEWLNATPAKSLVTGHQHARDLIVQSFTKVFGRVPTLLEAQFAQAASLCESNYGRACYTNKVTGEQTCGTNNMGSIQVVKPPCPEGTFEATDKHEDGTPYQVCFRYYNTPEEGFDHFIRVLYVGGKAGTKWNRAKVLEAANSGSIENFSAVLRASGYFELGLSEHIKALTACMKTVTKAMKEPMPSPPPATLTGTLKGLATSPKTWLLVLAGAGGYYYWKGRRR